VAQEAAPSAAPMRRVIRDGFLVASLNPKTTLFFAAFLPQFLGGPVDATTQTLLLGAMFVGLALITDSAYALLGGSLAGALRRGRSSLVARWTEGGILIALGLFTAAFGTRTGR
jgi:threonine/homoserine/homoserine lactone efflux protein